jgi:ribosomal protein S18 acetylase RimI-like enzyme
LGLAERTFGKDSAEYRAVLNFDRERRAGFLVHIRRCVVGFIVLDNRNIEHAEILAMAVGKSDRRSGIGSEMLHRIIRTGKRKTITARVRADAIDAHQFLRSQGFTVVAIGGMEAKQKSYVFQKVMESATVLRQDVIKHQPSLYPNYETNH